MPVRPRALSFLPASLSRQALAVGAAVSTLLGLGVLGGSQASARTAPAASAAPIADCLTMSPPTCYAPHQFRVAYSVQPLLDRGIDGRGETVVMPEFVATAGAPGVTDVRQDLATFDGLFGLPAARFQIITRFAGASSPYLANGEEAGDVEITHEIAPEASIRVILLPANSATVAIGTYAQALRLAPSLGGVVSITAGLGERCFTPAQVAALTSALQADRDHHVTVIASSGDNGAAIVPCPGTGAEPPVKGVNLPASDPSVLSVGGTSLQASHTTGAYLGETVWNTPVPPDAPQDEELPVASNGGFSSLFARPAYQAGVPGIGVTRGVPDVAADADQATGMALAVDVDSGYAILPGAGTSAGAPFWAGIVALADQYAGRHLGFVNPAIYRVARSFPPAFHDVTQGDNTVKYPLGTVIGYPATPGWDRATGWGSPDAQVLVPLLARYAGRQG